MLCILRVKNNKNVKKLKVRCSDPLKSMSKICFLVQKSPKMKSHRFDQNRRRGGKKGEMHTRKILCKVYVFPLLKNLLCQWQRVVSPWLLPASRGGCRRWCPPTPPPPHPPTCSPPTPPPSPPPSCSIFLPFSSVELPRGCCCSVNVTSLPLLSG